MVIKRYWQIGLQENQGGLLKMESLDIYCFDDRIIQIMLKKFSVEYNGTPLTENSMSGPNLTNKLIGVLIRSKEKRSVFTLNIELMLYQVRIPPERRAFLKLLWQEL